MSYNKRHDSIEIKLMKSTLKQLTFASIVLIAPLISTTQANAQQVVLDRQEIQINRNVELTPVCTPWYCREPVVLDVDIDEILNTPVCDPRVCDPPRELIQIREPLREVDIQQVENIRNVRQFKNVQRLR